MESRSTEGRARNGVLERAASLHSISTGNGDKDVVAYNAVAKKIMQEESVAINDLYAFALPRLKEIQRPVNVHFTDAGSAVLAEEVAKAIRQALKAR